MSRSSRTWAWLAAPMTACLLLDAPARALDDYASVGRAATPAELRAWDIDVRPDFLGLPKGSGTVEQGQAVWDGKCAACHGTFGESNKMFSPLVGGTSAEDMKTGHVAALKRTDFPARTTFMKVATVSTLFDYIRRAMPWNAPKSLSDDQVYAVLAYMLNLAEIVPDDFTLDERTIRDVQAMMPNRNGMTTDHALWPSTMLIDKADTRNPPCMKNCKTAPEIISTLPDHALASHGNIADQNRSVDEVRGQRTAASVPADFGKKSPAAIAETSGCLGCHAIDTRLIGPSYAEVAQKYKGQDVTAQLEKKVREGGEGAWGDVPMPPQEDLKDPDLKILVVWILKGAPAK